MLKHADDVDTNIPKFSRMVLTGFKKIVNFLTFVGTFRSGSRVINRLPFVTVARWSTVEANVRSKRDRASATVLSGRARGITGAGSTLH